MSPKSKNYKWQLKWSLYQAPQAVAVYSDKYGILMFFVTEHNTLDFNQSAENLYMHECLKVMSVEQMGEHLSKIREQGLELLEENTLQPKEDI